MAQSEEEKARALALLQQMAQNGQLSEAQMGQLQAMQSGAGPADPNAGRDTTYAQASNNDYMRQRLEALEASGDIRPGEQSTLDQLRGSQANDQAAINDTTARYRGFQKELTFNLADEVGGALGAAFDPNRDYGQVRDEIRARDILAEANNPQAFRQGQVAGAGASVALPAAGFGKVMQGANLGRQMLAGAALGGAMEGAREFAGGTGGFQNRMDGVPEATAWGAGFGAAMPAVARGGGALVNRLANRARPIEGVSARGVRTVMPAVKDSQQAMTDDIRQYLARLGNEGMPADVPGGMQHQAMGLASMGGEGGSTLGQAVSRRADGAGARIQNDMNQYIGAPNEAFNQRRALEAQRYSELGPQYDAALARNEPMDTAAIRQSLEQGLSEAGPSSTPALRQLLNSIPEEGMSATQLHRYRSDLSGQIEAARRSGNYTGDLQRQLGAMDQQLDTIPGYADARTGYANNKAMERAIDDGRQALRGGRATAQSPEQFQESFARMSPAQQDAYRAGIREDMGALMGTARNEAAAATGELNKAWTRDNLRTALGAQNADPLLSRVDAERAFADTRGRITQGSMTAQRRAAQEQLGGANPAPASGMSLVTGGMSDKLNEHVLQPLVFGPRRSALNQELGQFYSSQGPQRDAMLNAILEQAMAPERGTKTRALTELLLRNMMLGAGAGTNIDPANQQQR